MFAEQVNTHNNVALSVFIHFKLYGCGKYVSNCTSLITYTYYLIENTVRLSLSAHVKQRNR